MFKNAIAYLVTSGFRLDPEMLARSPSRQCAADEGHTMGFAAPCDHSTADLVHRVAGHTLICLETEDRLLPGSVVAEEVETRAIELENRQGYKPGRKQMRELKERVTEELLSKAFTQKRRTLGVFAGQYFIVDTSSPARAEMMIDALRGALDALPLSLINTKKRITGEMIQWLLGITPWGLTVDDFVELEKDEPGKPAIVYKRTTLDESDMRRRIADSYVPCKIGVTLNDRLSFKVDDSLHLMQVTALELMQVDKRHQHDKAEDVAQAFDADVTLMVGELVGAYNFLIDQLGGLAEAEPGLLTTGDMSEAVQALRNMDAMAKADGTTISIEHNGEVLATFGKEAA